MTWLEMTNLLFEKSNGLSPRGAHLHLDTAGWLRTWTPHQNQMADSAARHFSRYETWPPLDPDVGCLLYFRCLFALERCFEAKARGLKPPNSAAGRQEALESFLVTLWHLEGLEWAQRRYAPPRPRPRLRA